MRGQTSGTGQRLTRRRGTSRGADTHTGFCLLPCCDFMGPVSGKRHFKSAFASRHGASSDIPKPDAPTFPKTSVSYDTLRLCPSLVLYRRGSSTVELPAWLQKSRPLSVCDRSHLLQGRSSEEFLQSAASMPEHLKLVTTPDGWSAVRVTYMHEALRCVHCELGSHPVRVQRSSHHIIRDVVLLGSAGAARRACSYGCTCSLLQGMFRSDGHACAMCGQLLPA